MYVCICNNVTDSDIRQALSEGMSSIKDLNKNLSVGNCCGKCVCVARDVIRSYQTEGQFDLAQDASL
ncbi:MULTISPECIES: (2Fe-2S)-binding protein [Nitrincola]|uniref:Bacterioferritin-associated ferredoxin n=1 Tax=Nitrincola nitratireducens TaxID=1229521 RepID=W9VRH2_9GAMM|nr:MULTISPECIES: (2Fe-2S)-binding protein [Nitrincola]EXJ13005.1 Bacterioferritin-associated ferredoxin [Nitrincola nitratireducens]